MVLFRMSPSQKCPVFSATLFQLAYKLCVHKKLMDLVGGSFYQLLWLTFPAARNYASDM